MVFVKKKVKDPGNVKYKNKKVGWVDLQNLLKPRDIFKLSKKIYQNAIGVSILVYYQQSFFNV